MVLYFLDDLPNWSTFETTMPGFKSCLHQNQHEKTRAEGRSYDYSIDLLPPLGARTSQPTGTRKFIISPFNPRYRVWESFLILLVIYSAWFCPFEFAFLDYKPDTLFIIDHIVDGFFAIDIVLTFFLAYLDRRTYQMVDKPKEIAMKYLSTWFIFDVSSTVPFQPLVLLFTSHATGIGFKVLNMLRLWRLRRASALFARFNQCPSGIIASLYLQLDNSALLSAFYRAIEQVGTCILHIKP